MVGRQQGTSQLELLLVRSSTPAVDGTGGDVTLHVTDVSDMLPPPEDATDGPGDCISLASWEAAAQQLQQQTPWLLGTKQQVLISMVRLQRYSMAYQLLLPLQQQLTVHGASMSDLAPLLKQLPPPAAGENPQQLAVSVMQELVTAQQQLELVAQAQEQEFSGWLSHLESLQDNCAAVLQPKQQHQQQQQHVAQLAQQPQQLKGSLQPAENHSAEAAANAPQQVHSALASTKSAQDGVIAHNQQQQQQQQQKMRRKQMQCNSDAQQQQAALLQPAAQLQAEQERQQQQQQQQQQLERSGSDMSLSEDLGPQAALTAAAAAAAAAAWVAPKGQQDLASRLGGTAAAAADVLHRWPHVFILLNACGGTFGASTPQPARVRLQEGAVAWLLAAEASRPILQAYRGALVAASMQADAAAPAGQRRGVDLAHAAPSLGLYMTPLGLEQFLAAVGVLYDLEVVKVVRVLQQQKAAGKSAVPAHVVTGSCAGAAGSIRKLSERLGASTAAAARAAGAADPCWTCGRPSSVTVQLQPGAVQWLLGTPQAARALAGFRAALLAAVQAAAAVAGPGERRGVEIGMLFETLPAFLTAAGVLDNLEVVFTIRSRRELVLRLQQQQQQQAAAAAATAGRKTLSGRCPAYNASHHCKQACGQTQTVAGHMQLQRRWRVLQMQTTDSPAAAAGDHLHWHAGSAGVGLQQGAVDALLQTQHFNRLLQEYRQGLLHAAGGAPAAGVHGRGPNAAGGVELGRVGALRSLNGMLPDKLAPYKQVGAAAAARVWGAGTLFDSLPEFLDAALLLEEFCIQKAKGGRAALCLKPQPHTSTAAAPHHTKQPQQKRPAGKHDDDDRQVKRLHLQQPRDQHSPQQSPRSNGSGSREQHGGRVSVLQRLGQQQQQPQQQQEPGQLQSPALPQASRVWGRLGSGELSPEGVARGHAGNMAAPTSSQQHAAAGARHSPPPPPPLRQQQECGNQLSAHMQQQEEQRWLQEASLDRLMPDTTAAAAAAAVVPPPPPPRWLAPPPPPAGAAARARPLSAAEDLDLAVVGAFLNADEQQMRSSSSPTDRSSSRGRSPQLADCPSLLLLELLSALPRELLLAALPQRPSPAAALLAYLQLHPRAFEVRPGAVLERMPDMSHSGALALAAAGASASWHVQVRPREALQLLTRHERWAGCLPAVEAELLAAMKPRSVELPLVPRVTVAAAARRLERVLPQLRPYLQVGLGLTSALLVLRMVYSANLAEGRLAQVKGLLEAAVAALPLSDMFGLSCGAAFQPNLAAAAAAAGGTHHCSSTASSSFTHIELAAAPQLAEAAAQAAGAAAVAAVAVAAETLQDEDA
ncbi:hypothetical protein COO60DRAFT_1633822 [Scenedesmus sp. NREL 46B-D3]|nr:hypothetical protein COO60DRAFT_1633822 [Scenedesmus sp. NREL 46B-D3]